jgi:gamma-glutamylcyclotransferase
LTLPSKTFLYFAYASNLNKKQMQERCPDCKPRFSAILPNYKLAFAGWSRTWHGAVATISPFRGEKVRGAIYEITNSDFTKLDSHEIGYSHLNVTVFDEDNQPHQALTYIKNGPIQEALPSKEYAAVIKQGYRDWSIG